MAEINPLKLALIPEVDAWVQVQTHHTMHRVD